MIGISFLGLLFVAFFFFYILYWEPVQEEKRKNAEFSASVCGIATGAYMEEDFRFGCSISEIHSYIRRQIDVVRKLPSTSSYLEYNAPNGQHYEAHIISHDAVLFAYICLIQIADYNDRLETTQLYQSKLELARKCLI